MGIFDIEPHQVSKDLRGYSVLLYGDPKSGKTSTAVKFPKHLLLAFEKGYAAIPGAMALPINTWPEFLRALRDLKKPEAKEKFETIIVDTADIAYDLCERFVCSQNDVDSIGDIPFGKGYGLVAKEFDEKMRQIVQMDFGLVLISHAVDKVFTDELGNETNQIVPTLPKKAQTIVARMCDIIGYSRSVENEAGNLETRLFMRGTQRFIAGSRFTHTPDSIVFNYDNLVGAIADAVDKLEEEYGSEAVTAVRGEHNHVSSTELNLEDILAEFNELASSLMENDETYYGPRIQQAIERHFGRGKKMSEATLDQVEIADLVLFEIKQLAPSGTAKK